ncbi:hypothetical protein HPP92_007810 [Vanilla planifolia]|uniref:Uncharacterized protein n=1 Tax=Vanilla planifolia TaxID=51239 RepID=A0A835RRX2_VANPL|nr:hypothetical protein HPP92_007810 [Vanilla planifolia]
MTIMSIRYLTTDGQMRLTGSLHRSEAAARVSSTRVHVHPMLVDPIPNLDANRNSSPRPSPKRPRKAKQGGIP